MASTATQFDTDCVLMLHMDGADTSTTFTDSSFSNTKTVTAGGGAQLSTTSPKFGTAAGLFDGTTDYLTSADNSDWNLGTGDFTIDFWVKFTNLPGSGVQKHFVDHYTSGSYATNGSYLFYILNTAGTYTLNFESYVAGDITVSKTWSAPSTATWYHLAVIRTGTTIRIFVDGTQIGTDGTDGHDLTQTTTLTIGADSAGLFSLDGRLDELRIVKGTAVWTSNFTAPSAAYTQVTSASKFALLGVG